MGKTVQYNWRGAKVRDSVIAILVLFMASGSDANTECCGVVDAQDKDFARAETGSTHSPPWNGLAQIAAGPSPAPDLYTGSAPGPSSAFHRQALELLSLSPALFVENRGQWSDPSVRYVHKGSRINVAMTESAMLFQIAMRTSAQEEDQTSYVLKSSRFQTQRNLVPEDADMRLLQFSASFVGAVPVWPVGLERSQSDFNYFVGNQANWHENVPAYHGVAYQGLYDGIDLHVWGLWSHLKYEFHIAPGADYRRIATRYEGIRCLSITDDGSLAVDLGPDWGVMRDNAPYIYQRIDDQKVELTGRFVMLDPETYTFEVTGDIHPDHALVIDPNLAWSSYLGGSQEDYAYAIAADEVGNIYVAGQTYSDDWITNINLKGGLDGFLTKLTSIGGHVWSTYVGGENGDGISDIALDAAENVYVTGWTSSTDWITGGYDTSFNGYMDAFVAKLTSAGGHVWSSYVGGSDMDTGSCLAVDTLGNVYMAGDTTSSNWELDIWVSGGFDTDLSGGRDAFVTKLTNAGDYLWGSYVGGESVETGYGIALDTAGYIYMTGATKSLDWATGGFDTSFNGDADAFVVKLTNIGDHAWSTYFGGEGYDMGKNIALDTNENVYVIGDTNSVDLTTGGFDTSFNGETDTFLAKLTSTGDHVWSTYMGGYFGDWPHDLAVDANGSVYVTGYTESDGWVSGGFDTSYDGGPGAFGDPFVAKLTGAGDHVWSTYLGGYALDSGSGIVVDATENVYVVGSTYSDDWVSGGFDTSHGGAYDAFVAKITDEIQSQEQLIPGESYVGNINASDWQVFFIDVEAGEHLLVTLQPGLPSGRLEFYGRYSEIPTVSIYDCAARARNAAGNYELLIPSTESGRYYFAVYARDIDDPMGYTLTASFVSRHVSNVYPQVVARSESVSIHIMGIGFVQRMQVEMQGVGGSLLSAKVVVLSSSTMIVAQFDLSGVALGLYDVAVIWPEGHRVEIPETLEIKELQQGAVSAVPDLQLIDGETFTLDVNVPETQNLFVTLQKTTLVSYGNSWRGQLTLLRDGTTVASTAGSHDLILHVVDPVPGLYEIRVTTEQAGEGILTVWTTLPELSLGQWTTGTVYCSYGSVWYQVDVPPGQGQLVFEAEAMGLWSHFDIYLGQYRSLDHWVSEQGTRISLEIPDPDPGIYIVEFLDSAMISGQSGWAEDQSRDVLLKADTIIKADPDPDHVPNITSIAPDKGGNTGVVTVEIIGGWLDPNAAVSLVRGDQPDITALIVNGELDKTRLTVVFDLESQQPGLGYIVVTNPNGQTATSPVPFVIGQGGEPELWLDIIGKEKIRTGRSQTYVIKYGNSGYISADNAELLVWFPRGVTAKLTDNREGLPPVFVDPDNEEEDIAGFMITLWAIAPQSEGESYLTITVPEDFDAFKINARITQDFGASPESETVSLADSLSFQVDLQSNLLSDQDSGQKYTIEGQEWTGCLLALGGKCYKFSEHAVIVLPIFDPNGNIVGYQAWTEGTGQLISGSKEQIERMLRDAGRYHDGSGKNIELSRDEIERYRDELNDYTVGEGGKTFRHKEQPFMNPQANEFDCIGILEYCAEQAGVNNGDGLLPKKAKNVYEGWLWKDALGIDKNVLYTHPPGIGQIPKEKAIDGTISRYIIPVNSMTPEDKYGPAGYDVPGTPLEQRKRFVRADRNQYYRVDYWNKEDATAPAYDVLVKDQLESNLDWDSFMFEDFGFLKWNIDLEPCQYFNVNVDTRPDMDWIVNVEGTFDPENGQATWWFKTLDPNTLETPEDPMAGFLLPITESGEEIGWVGFTVRAKPGLPTGTQIANQAFVEFDHAGDLYDHPAPKEGPWVNTLDAEGPTSQVSPLPETIETRSFLVEWSGQDDLDGSGIQGYDIYVSTDGNDYVLWLANIDDTSATFIGEGGHTYSFYSRARDNVGHVEPAPASPDSTTTSVWLTGDFCGPNFGPPDGYVDVWDLMDFADHWHAQTGEGNWDAKFDLAGPNFGAPEGYIDVWDLMVFADHWHEGERPRGVLGQVAASRGPPQDSANNTFEQRESTPQVTLDLPGMHLVDPSTDLDGQTVYLDFDGEEDVVYNGPAIAGPFDVPAFSLDGTELAGQEQQIIEQVVAELERTFAGTGITFAISQPPQGIEYSTVHIGGDDSAFTAYGLFLGLAEQVDESNQDPRDDGFVFSDVCIADYADVESLAEALTQLVARETGHLLGYAHDVESVGKTNDPLFYVADAGTLNQDEGRPNHPIVLSITITDVPTVVIVPNPIAQMVIAGDPVSITATYSTEDPVDETLTGLGLRSSRRNMVLSFRHALYSQDLFSFD